MSDAPPDNEGFSLTGMAQGDGGRMRAILLNFVNGFPPVPAAPAEGEGTSAVAEIADLAVAYPEIAPTTEPPVPVRADSPEVVARLFGSAHQGVIAVVNLSPEPVTTTLWVPGFASLLLDRWGESSVPLAGGLAWMDLPGHAARAYELR